MLLWAWLWMSMGLAWGQDGRPPDSTETVRILWSGAEGGIRSGQVRFHVYERVREGKLLDVERVRPVHGWMVRSRWAITAEDRTLASTLALFRAGDLQCEAPEPATRLQDLEETLVLPGKRLELAKALETRALPVSIRECTAGGVRARLIGPATAPLPDLSPERWETRLGLAWTLADGTVVDSIGRPKNEGTRRFAVLRAARSQADVFVDAGRFVDGVSSVRDGDLSLHRPTAFALLRALTPTALVPGETELAAGPAALLAEAPDLPWTAANWKTEVAELQLPTSRRITLSTGTRVAFVGIVDPGLAKTNPRFASDKVEITDPVAAVDRLLDEVEDADLVVVLTSARASVLNSLRTDLRGVDLIVGDRDVDTRRLSEVSFSLRAEAAERRQTTALTLPLGGATLAEIDLAEDGLVRGVVRPLPVPLTVTPDPETLARVTGVRADAYPSLEDPLLHPTDPAGVVSQNQLERAVCETVLEEAGADLALLPRLPVRNEIPGPLTALLIADHLALPDQVEIHRVPGTAYRTLLDRTFGLGALSCGSPLGQRFPKARGRPVEDRRVYTVVTTDRLRSTTVLDGLLAGARSTRLLDRPGTRPLTTDAGAKRSLRTVALDRLRTLREAHGEALLTDLLARSPNTKDPRFDLRIRQLSLKIEGFQGVDDEAYGEIPETRATSPSSFTLGSAADIALEYSSAKALWDLRARSAFTRLRTADGPQEAADDAKLSSSVTAPGARIPLGPTSLQPFAEALLDSEITPTETEDGSVNPRQADASLTVGLSTPITGWLRQFRLGMLVLQDLSVTSKRPEIGARLEGQTRVVIGPGLAWTNQLDAFYYGDTSDQDASDLRFKVYFQTRLGLPLARWLDVALFWDAFVFQGRVDQTRAVSGSFTLGAGLDLGGVFGL